MSEQAEGGLVRGAHYVPAEAIVVVVAREEDSPRRGVGHGCHAACDVLIAEAGDLAAGAHVEEPGDRE